MYGEEDEEEEDVFDFIIVVFVIINSIVCGCECVLSSLFLLSFLCVCDNKWRFTRDLYLCVREKKVDTKTKEELEEEARCQYIYHV